MNPIKTLALAAVFAAGTSAHSLAEEAAPDSIVNNEPIFGTYSATAPSTTYVPQTMTPSGSYLVPASPWVTNRFNPSRAATVEENWFFRAEAENTGSSGSSD